MSQLTQYLQTTGHNIEVMRQRGGALVKLLSDISDVFALGHETFQPRSGGVGSAFFPGSYSSFLAAANLALCLHVVEAYKPLRGCLEGAAYTLHAEHDPSAYQRWLSRPLADDLSEDPVARRAQVTARRRVGVEFSVTTIANEIRDERLRERFLRRYEESIDRGAHYNVHAFRRGFEIVSVTERTVRARVLTNEESDYVVCLRDVAAGGLVALEVMNAALGEQWDSGLISSRVAGLNRRLIKRHSSKLSKRGTR